MVPGTCLVKTTGENYAIAGGAAEEQVFGLLGQWVGGTFDGVKNTNNISAWQGPDSEYDLLAPGFNPAELATTVASNNKEGKPVYLYPGFDGRLVVEGAETAQKASNLKEGKLLTPVAVVIEYNPSVLRFRLLI